MRITVNQVAIKLNKSPQYIRLCLQRGLLPFGTATQLPGSKRWNYLIFPEKFKEYVGNLDETEFDEGEDEL